MNDFDSVLLQIYWYAKENALTEQQVRDVFHAGLAASECANIPRVKHGLTGQQVRGIFDGGTA